MIPPVSARLPLLGISALVGLAVAGAAVGRATGSAEIDRSGSVVTQRELLFEDRSDGAVVVRSAGDLRPVEVLQGENGFLRGTLRGFARTRKAERVGPALPFRLARWSDGRLTLDDPSTGRHAELMAFGPDNAGVFAHLLTAGAP